MLTAAVPSELPVYARIPFSPVRGAGAVLEDAAGRRMLDLYGGHAVALTGHCHPRVVAALQAQSERLLFYSNAVDLAVRAPLFELLAELAPPALANAFLVNSGAEANEVALQLARRVTGRRRLVTCEGGFHGRTLATLAASGIPRYRQLASASGGADLVAATTICPFNDAGALTALVDDSVAAVLVEPVQGLAGARDATAEFLHAARAACDAAGALLVFDEVQCGCGRTGAFTAAQSYGVAPDLLTLAKGIAAGLPMGVVLMTGALAATVGPGDLGTTFGGGPLPCVAAAANLAVLRDDDLAGRVRALERQLRSGLTRLPAVRAVSGRGLLLGVVLDRPAKPVQAELLARGMLTGSAIDPAVLRLLPPLVLSDDEAASFVTALQEVLT